jgi:hypothetical protein
MDMRLGGHSAETTGFVVDRFASFLGHHSNFYEAPSDGTLLTCGPPVWVK